MKHAAVLRIKMPLIYEDIWCLCYYSHSCTVKWWFLKLRIHFQTIMFVFCFAITPQRARDDGWPCQIDASQNILAPLWKESRKRPRFRHADTISAAVTFSSV